MKLITKLKIVKIAITFINQVNILMYLLQALTDYGVASKVIDAQKESLLQSSYLRNMVIILIIVNGLSLILNFIVQSKLKNKDKIIHAFKIREEKRLGIYEQIYRDLVKLSLLNPQADVQAIVANISVTERYISDNNLYIESGAVKIISNTLDYFKVLTRLPGQKDIKKEKTYLENFKKHFNRNT